MSRIKLYSDWDSIEKELNRLKRVAKGGNKIRLDQVLNWGLNRLKQDVHIETHSLKPSGKAESVMFLGRYSGTITFGGFTTGPRNPVDYTIFEMGKGGSHDFMRHSYLMHPLWVQAIKEIISE